MFSVMFCAWIAAAEACSTIDMSSQIVGPKYQGQRSYCYAFATSNALSAALDLKPPESVSALELLTTSITASKAAVEKAASRVEKLHGSAGTGLGEIPASYDQMIFKNQPLPTRQRGFSELLAAQVVDRGYVCTEAQVPSQRLWNSGDLPAAVNYLDRTFENTTGMSMNAPEAIYMGERVYGQPRVCDQSFLNAQARAAHSIGGAANDWAIAGLRDRTYKDCKRVIPVPKMRVTAEAFNGHGEDQKLARSALDRALEAKKPFVLAFNRCLTRLCSDRREVNAHEVTVIGREPDENGVCQLVLRDNYGTKCGVAEPGASCRNGDWRVPMDRITGSPIQITRITKVKANDPLTSADAKAF